MHKHDHNRVVFYSKEDMLAGHYLTKSEHILERNFTELPTDINDLLELYNIKKYFDHEMYLKKWSESDIEKYKQRVELFEKYIGQFMSKVNDENVLNYHQNLVFDYVESFWKLVNDQKTFKQISADIFREILKVSPHQIRVFLKLKGLIDKYNNVIRDFLLTYQQSAEIILNICEVKKDFNEVEFFLPKSLSKEDKELIINNYIDSEECNINYLPIIENSRKTNKLKLSDKTRLKAKKKYQLEINQFFDEKSNGSSLKYGVSISYPQNYPKIKNAELEGTTIHYSYSLDFIRQNTQPYLLYRNFKSLFEYLDQYNRITLTSKLSQVGVFERSMGVRSQNEYFCGLVFNHSQMTSQAQIFTYSNILKSLDTSLEEVLQFIYTSFFSKKYGYAKNAILAMPTLNASPLERVRSIAPELESILKQYKLFVEDNHIDFELLQMSSSPCSMKDIPSLNKNKYIYLNTNNAEAVICSHLFFSDQTLLSYVEPFKEKNYITFFDLLRNEIDIYFNNYKEYQIPKIYHLIEQNYIFIDEQDRIQVTNPNRVHILKDLHKNEFSTYYHYPAKMQEEALKMEEEGLIYFDSSLLSKSEQDYFNFFLNKSEFSNGLDLRNSYLHGTQANPSKFNLHENSYLIYLKLLTLILMKIEDDLQINQNEKETNNALIKP